MSLRLLAIAVFACQSLQASAQSLLDKARQDEVATVRTGDPAMAAAMTRARSELDTFLGIAAAPPAGAQNFTVKVRLPVGRDSSEYIWIHPFKRDGDRFVGTVASTPRHFSNLSFGNRLAFERKDIVDWSYKKGERTVGNYTACALLKHEPPQQRDAFRREYGLECPD